MNPDLFSLLPISFETIDNFSSQNNNPFFVEDLINRIELIKHKLKFFPDKPKVAFITSVIPTMVSSNWVAELVETAGGKPIIIQIEAESLTEIWEKISVENPDIIIVMPLGFTIASTLQNINLLLDLPNWNNTTAVKNNRVYIANAAEYFNVELLNLVDSLEILAEIIHPKYLNFGYEGTGWIKFETNIS